MRKKVLSTALSLYIAAGSVLCAAGDTTVYAAQAVREEQESETERAELQEGQAGYEVAAQEESLQENTAHEILAAEDSRAKASQDWQWDVLEDGTVSIKNYSGTETEVEIPSQLEGKKVTTLGYYAFKGNTGITNIRIPDTVTTLEDTVFSCCTALKEIVIPSSVSSIGEEVFLDCYSLTDISVASDNQAYMSEDGVLFNKAKTELIAYPLGNARTGYDIPEGVKELRGYAFNMANLTKIQLPSSLQHIGDSALHVMDTLEEITFPEGLVSIGDYALGSAQNKTLHIPSSLKQIGMKSLTGFSDLTAIMVGAANPSFSEKDGILFNKKQTKLVSYPAAREGRTYAVPSSVTEIGISAFVTNEFTNLDIPANVVKIGSNAFRYSPHMKYIKILNPRCEIEEFTDLLDITIPRQVTIYGYEGSTAQAFAKDHDNPFESLGEAPEECRHNYQTTVKKATTSKNGSIQKICSICKKAEKAQAIPYPKTIKFSRASVVYNGKQQKPPVTVTDSAGKKVAAENYSVTYSNNKNVGKGTATVTFKNNYTGRVKKTFQIQPKGTRLSKVSPKAKGITKKKKKQAVQTSGYQIQYSENSKFKGNTTKLVKIGKNKTVSKAVSGLKAGKKYYVRIRTYTMVNGKKTAIYSSWSQSKNIRTR